jgi:hypothetical protein
MYGFDSTMLILLPAILIAMYAQNKVRSTYAQYSRVANRSGMTGSDAARLILDRAGLYEVPVEQVAGDLTDHYDPRSKKLRLSQGVYNSSSIAALGIAAHEVGHAIQDQQEYIPMKIRGALVPVASIGGNFGLGIFILGLFLSIPVFQTIGIVLFSATVFFQLVTLPVEFNASSRAMAVLEGYSILESDELGKARQVLNAAALTYIAAALSGIANLARLLILRNRRR